ncbi:FtsX-like permease family protein, partial [Ruminococcaceae bacterium OttesenSCG-928-A11]|nr:FtsX-like permease family protein [Ruminococcaceae bacterium OttesenSCG-928-A11]
WLSTIRKPSRSIILIVILFVMANLLLATVAIKNSVDASMTEAKNKLDGTVNLTIDSDKIREQMQSGEGVVDIASLTIDEELAQGISQSNYLKDYTYSISATANADSYNVVTTAQNEREMQFRDAFNNAQEQITDAQNQATQNQQNLDASVQQFNESSVGSSIEVSGPGGGGMPSGGGARFGGFQMNFNISNVADPTLTTGDTAIIGINAYSFISEVDSGSLTIVDGEAFDENSGNGVIISQELAEANSISVGDTIKLKTVADDSEIELNVLGIYQVINENFDDNTIYMNIEQAKKFYSSEQLEKLSVSSVKYYLNSASEKDAFLAEIKEKYPSLESDGLKLDVDTSSYDQMVEPIEKVGGFATTIMWIVMAASVVIITLIVVINVKDRRYEMGVLLSLGSNKIGIVGQILVELLIVGTVGFLLSFATSGIVADKLGEQLMTSNNNETSEQIEAGPGQMMMNRGRNMASTTNQITKVNVRASVNDYLVLFGAIYTILIIAMILPSVNILRYQPKTILTGKE